MPRPAKVPAVSLVEDHDFWPRIDYDSNNVASLTEALLAGDVLPPVVADRQSRRIIDGWHRRRATLRAFGKEAEIEVFLRDYADEAEMYKEAVKLNSAHGRKLTPYDHARIMERSKELGINLETIAGILHMRKAKLKDKTKYGIKMNGSSPTNIPLKRPLRYLDGQVLTPAQESYNEVSSGWEPIFHANQLIAALEAGLPEVSRGLGEALEHLRGLIDTVLV